MPGKGDRKINESEQGIYESERLDHLSIVVGVYQEIGLARYLDAQEPYRHRQISVGTATVVMVLKGLGFSNRPLYLVPQYFEHKPLEHLLGAQIKAENLNDDCLGRTLAWLYEHDVTRLFAGIARKAREKLSITSRLVHVDTTSFSVSGAYEAEPEAEAAISITYGYSRDHRADLKQWMMALATDFSSSGGNTPVPMKMIQWEEEWKPREQERLMLMRKKKTYNEVVKRIFHPEMTHCLQCQHKLHRCVTISDRMLITLKQVIRVVHCGYRCPDRQCAGRTRLYRSAQADALALPGFTFGLDIVLEVGHLRLRAHQTVDEIHQTLSGQLALFQQTISRREILFLFEAYSALLRAGTEVTHDECWKEQVSANKGILLSIDGIQPDKGNETIYLLRDVLTGRILHAENVTESTKERLKQLLAPVVALKLPVIGVISDAQPTELQAVAELWPGVPHQICQFHAIREAGRLIYNADHRVKTDMRISMQERTHAYRHHLHHYLREAGEQTEENQQEITQVRILEEYAAMVEGALNIDGIKPFGYAGLEMQEALTSIQTSLKKLEKRGAHRTKHAASTSAVSRPL